MRFLFSESSFTLSTNDGNHTVSNLLLGLKVEKDVFNDIGTEVDKLNPGASWVMEILRAK